MNLKLFLSSFSVLGIGQQIFLVSGPSGSGKNTLLSELGKAFPDDLTFSVSATTRAKRTGEVDGVHYHFLSESEFQRRLEAGEFLEYAQVHGKNYYGTLRSEADRALRAGKHLLIDADVQGWEQITRYPDAAIRERVVDIFVAPPTLRSLIPRIAKRLPTPPLDEVISRMQSARREMKSALGFSYVLVNDNLDTAIRDILNIFQFHAIPLRFIPWFELFVSLRSRQRQFRELLVSSMDEDLDVEALYKEACSELSTVGTQ